MICVDTGNGWPNINAPATLTQSSSFISLFKYTSCIWCNYHTGTGTVSPSSGVSDFRFRVLFNFHANICACGIRNFAILFDFYIYLVCANITYEHIDL